MAAQTLSSILLSNPQIKRAYQQAQLLWKIQAHLRPILSKPLADHCQTAAFSNGILTLHTDSSAWAARLRFMSADILKACQTDPALNAIKTIRVRVRPPVYDNPNNRPVSGKASLSPQTVQLLRNTAESIQDAGLRAALLRLSRY